MIAAIRPPVTSRFSPGLYAFRFDTPIGEGAGVAWLRDGDVRGRDSLMAYTGTYAAEGDAFRTEVHGSTPTSPAASRSSARTSSMSRLPAR